MSSNSSDNKKKPQVINVKNSTKKNDVLMHWWRKLTDPYVFINAKSQICQ